MRFLNLNKFVFFLTIGLLLLFFNNPLQAKVTQTQEEYFAYFTNFENILLIKPTFIKEIFYGIVELKGNPRQTHNILDNKFFSCLKNGLQEGNCRLDKLRLKKREKKVHNSFTIPVNFSEVSLRRYNKNQKLVTLRWKPVMFAPPTLSVEEFLNYIFASEDSDYYLVDPSLFSIQVTTHFENKIEFILNNRMAVNLKKLYQTPPKDFQDSLTFFQSTSSMVKRAGIGTLNVYMKTKWVRINHQKFPVELDLKL